MRFEVLVEDRSGRAMLEVLIPKIIGNQHKVRIRSYKGIGRIPKNLASGIEARNRLLLNNLPGELRAYGKDIPSRSSQLPGSSYCSV